MPVSPDVIHSLLLELEVSDPQEFATLSLSEVEARRLVCASVAEFTANLEEQGLPAAHREVMALAMCARLVLENLVLNAERLQREGQAHVDARALLRALARRR